jgi:hypothetical protein
MRKLLAHHLRANISNWLVDTARRERRAVTTKLQNLREVGKELELMTNQVLYQLSYATPHTKTTLPDFCNAALTLSQLAGP